jgi:hypothetical protein
VQPDTPRTTTLPASAEVLEHHLQEHRCGDVGFWLPIRCGCESVALGVCRECDEPLFVFVLPGHSMCLHGLEILELAKDPRPWKPWREWDSLR